jgi:hypothetical protein
MPRFLQRLSPRVLLWGLLALSALVYVGNTWSPSSYALALQAFSAPEDGLVLGAARGIRSDEWAVITPLTQATVNNGFARYNERSLYGEDLRSTYQMPLWDWGLAFKPTMWLYPLVNAAYAFSFHHFSITALFLIGYALLFRRLGMRNVPAVLLSLTLFFTSFTQYWWTTIGPPMAWFPWLLWVFLSEAPLAVRLAGFYWVATSWLLSMFYPPLFIPLAFAAVALLLAFTPERLRQPKVLLGFAVVGGLACVTVLLYLQDWLRGTLHTVYPGERRVGGGGFGLERFLSIFLPNLRLQRHEPLVSWSNVCELSMVGSSYFLMVLCFLRYGALGEAWKQGRLRPLRVLVPAVLLMSAWLFLPVPSWLGKPLLWHFVPSVRMAFAYGLLLLVLAYTLSEGAGLEPSPLRVLLFAGVLFGAWYQYKLAEHGILEGCGGARARRGHLHRPLLGQAGALLRPPRAAGRCGRGGDPLFRALQPDPAGLAHLQPPRDRGVPRARQEGCVPAGGTPRGGRLPGRRSQRLGLPVSQPRAAHPAGGALPAHVPGAATRAGEPPLQPLRPCHPDRRALAVAPGHRFRGGSRPCLHLRAGQGPVDRPVRGDPPRLHPAAPGERG